MTGILGPILQSKVAELQAEVRQAWAGREREAVIEIVRSADYTAYLKYFAPDDNFLEHRRLILDGVAPALATFLPLMPKKGRGLPFGASPSQLADLTDSMLVEFGKLAQLQRVAAMERYGLSRIEMANAVTMRIEVQAGVAESMDRRAGQWFQAETIRRFAMMQGPPPDKKSVESLLDTTCGVQDGWFIRYEGHEALIKWYRDRAMLDVLGCAESEALPHEAMIGGRPFAEWRAICAAALGRVFNHVAYATRLKTRFPALSLRDLLTVPVLYRDLRAVWIEAGERAKHVRDTMSHLTLDAQTIAPWQDHHEIPAPFYVDVGGGWYLLSLFGGLLNPICGLVRTLRLKHRGDWDRAVNRREFYFRRDIRNQFGEPRFLVPDHGMTLRREDGSHLTDVDAVILDRETGSLALIQLKWPDIFGLSLKERDSRRLSLLEANEWVDRVSGWVANRNARQVAKTLGIAKEASKSKPPVLMVIPRYAARFTLNDVLDDRACWVAWPEVVRMRIEKPQIADPLAELERYKGGGSLGSYDCPEGFTYKLRGLDVHLSVV